MEYTDAARGETTGAGIPGRSADIPHTAFAAAEEGTPGPGRLVVRGMPGVDAANKQAAGQDLFDVWLFHAFFTTAPTEVMDTVAADKTNHHHAIIEQVRADLKGSAVAHLPSGKYTANPAWLVLAAIASNLTGAAATIMDEPAPGKSMTATIRRSPSDRGYEHAGCAGVVTCREPSTAWARTVPRVPGAAHYGARQTSCVSPFPSLGQISFTKFTSPEATVEVLSKVVPGQTTGLDIEAELSAAGQPSPLWNDLLAYDPPLVIAKTAAGAQVAIDNELLRASRNNRDDRFLLQLPGGAGPTARRPLQRHRMVKNANQPTVALVVRRSAAPYFGFADER